MSFDSIFYWSPSWWKELPTDFQGEICARLPVEFVYRHRMICKQWNEFLSSNYFLTRWAKASLNRNEARLVVCDFSMQTPCMDFCFYTRTWSNSCLDVSFLKEVEDETASFKQYAGGLILVENIIFGFGSSWGELCNLYTRTFVKIPNPHSRFFSSCIVVDEKDDELCDTTYKVAVVVGEGDRWWETQQLMEIYEPSQKRWKIAGYFPENLSLKITELLYCNGITFYTQCSWMEAEGLVHGIGCFTIPLEEGTDSAIAPNLIPFPRELTKGALHSRMITYRSGLLFISENFVSVRRRAGGRRKRKKVVGMSVWELKFKSDEGYLVPLSNSPAWEWVKIAQMPSSLREEWRETIGTNGFYWDCAGVGDHVCFAYSLFYKGSREVEDFIAYNLIDNTWSWLPSCPLSHYNDFHGYAAIAVEPNLSIKLQ